MFKEHKETENVTLIGGKTKSYTIKHESKLVPTLKKKTLKTTSWILIEHCLN
jgi:hypothetical protein